MIIVLGHLRVAPADRPRFLASSAIGVLAARAAKGNIDFVVGADLVEDDRVNVCERWADRASLDAYRGEGPGEDLGSMIRAFHVREITVDDEA